MTDVLWMLTRIYEWMSISVSTFLLRCGINAQKVFLILEATSVRISPIFFCQWSTCLDSAHHSSPCRGSAFSQRFRTSSCCSCADTTRPAMQCRLSASHSSTGNRCLSTWPCNLCDSYACAWTQGNVCVCVYIYMTECTSTFRER